MSPYELVLLLDIYCSPAFMDKRNEPILRETLNAFRARGLIVFDDRRPHNATVTAKGEAYVKAVLGTPMPTMVWRCANGVEIEVEG